MPEWEIVNNSTYRLEVPGGWLYRHVLKSHENMQMVFVPLTIDSEWKPILDNKQGGYNE